MRHGRWSRVPGIRHSRNFVRQLWLALCISGCCLASAQAERHYEMIIPIAAGGSMDLMARAVSQAMSQELGESVIPMNKVGASLVIGTRYVAEDRSADGRLLLFQGMPYTTQQFKQSGPAFDEKRLKPVIYVGWQPTVLFTRATIPATSMQAFLEWAKHNPNGVTFASSGIGSSPHIAAEQLAAMTGIKITNIPMAGSSAFVPAVAGGHVDAVFDAPTTRSMVQAGRLHALMVGQDKPLSDWPELPTASASGLAGFKSGTWYGVFVPASTPDATVKKLNQILNKALKRNSVQARSREFQIDITGGTPEQFAAFLRSEHDRIGGLVSNRGIVIP